MKHLIQPQNHAFPWNLERDINRFVDYPELRPGQATTPGAATSRLTMRHERMLGSGGQSRFGPKVKQAFQIPFGDLLQNKKQSIKASFGRQGTYRIAASTGDTRLTSELRNVAGQTIEPCRMH